MNTGILYGISVGTGDPELITVKGLRILQQSNAIAFPSGINNRPGIARSIISRWLESDKLLIPLDFPYLQEPKKLQQAWQAAAETVWSYLERGMNVSFACLGDIGFYSTFTYLARTLKELHPDARIEYIPGVSSPMAISSVLQIPLTEEKDKLAVLPALYSVRELEAVLDWAETVVLLKVSSVYQSVWQILEARNLLASSWIVEKATFSDQKIYVNLQEYPNLQLSYFSVLLIKNSLA